MATLKMSDLSVGDFIKERDRLLAEIEQLKKERAELEEDAKELMA